MNQPYINVSRPKEKMKVKLKEFFNFDIKLVWQNMSTCIGIKTGFPKHINEHITITIINVTQVNMILQDLWLRNNIINYKNYHSLLSILLYCTLSWIAFDLI